MTLVRPSVAVISVVLGGAPAHAQEPAGVTATAQALTPLSAGRRLALYAKLRVLVTDYEAKIERPPANPEGVLDLYKEMSGTLDALQRAGDRDLGISVLVEFKRRHRFGGGPQQKSPLLKAYYARGERFLREMEAHLDARKYAEVGEKWRTLQQLCQEMAATDEMFHKACDDLLRRGEDCSRRAIAAQQTLLDQITKAFSATGGRADRRAEAGIDAFELLDDVTVDLPKLVQLKRDLCSLNRDLLLRTGLEARRAHGEKLLGQMTQDFSDGAYAKVSEQWEVLKDLCVRMYKHGGAFEESARALFNRGQALRDKAEAAMRRN